MKKSGEIFLGLMSGTSMDGIDAAVVRLGEQSCEVLAGQCISYPDTLRDALLSVKQDPGSCSIDKLAQLDSLVGECFAAAANEVLQAGEIERKDVVAIGSHGQTIRHQPDSEPPFTLQIGDPNIIASRTGMTVVADFRRRDVAAGGQGAPLTPAFHQWLFRDDQKNRAVLNIGGIANITVLIAGDEPVTGFDTGPGNTLMDAWIKRHRDLEFDDAGRWSAQGSSSGDLLDVLLRDRYFSMEPPKSTGFEYFNLGWLDQKLMELATMPSENDVQATLAELSCRTIADAIRRHAPTISEIFVCGGGVHNRHLLSRLAEHLPGISVQSTATRGLDPDWVEAAAFAWLAKCRIDGTPGNLPSATGASESVLLGGVFAAVR